VSIKPPAPPPLPKIRTERLQPQAKPEYPTVAPQGVAPEKPRPDSGWEDTTAPVGIIDGGPPSDIVVPPPPPPVEQKPVQVGGNIRRPQKLNDVQPVYPPMAQAARVQGIVIVEATLGADGRVMNARVLRSIPLLDNAALDAVREWEFTPTLLNGVPVPVVMTVTVSFVLSR
jgi:periplasmic protein TonB